MPVTVIPFKMPEPMEIPAHIADSLRQMAPDDAVKKGMELLLQIDAAETVIYERVNGDGNLELGSVVSSSGEANAVEERLGAEAGYGQPLTGDSQSMAGAAFAEKSPLLIMGQAQEGDEMPLPESLKALVLNGAEVGNVGFIYVLTFVDGEQTPLGALTLIRSPDSGPLNHEQPNITEGLRQVLNEIICEAA